MSEVTLFENLIESAAKITYENKDDFDVLEKRTEMIIRKVFGDNTHYLDDLNNISYSPMIVSLTGHTNWKSPFESGLKQFKNLLQVMLEDVKLSSNYEDDTATEIIKLETDKTVDSRTIKEVKVLIASPGDVKLERELLMDKLETKFRREHYEERCGARIIVDGWESVPTQSGYSQDIINEDLLEKTDIVLAVFRHKLGSPTINIKTGEERNPSGTAEELLFAIRNKKISNPPLGMAYFFSNAPVISLDSMDKEKIEIEWKRLKEFREEIKNEILYKTYKIEEEILSLTCEDLCSNILKYLKS